MTDDLAADLDKIVIPAFPNDYALLKSLIQSLPSPLSPEVRSAIAGSLNTVSPNLTAAAQTQSVMAGVPIGSESGSAIGVVSELFYGNANYLSNPLIDEQIYPNPTMGTTATEWANGWSTRYVSNSGATPSCTAGVVFSRISTIENPLNSSLAYVTHYGALAGAVDYTTYTMGGTWTSDLDPGLPWLVAAVKISRQGNTNDAGVTAYRARMEITDGAASPTLLASGAWFDLFAVSGSQATYRISAALPRPAGGWWDGAAKYGWRMRVDYVTNAAQNPVLGDGLYFGEPVLALSASQSPPPFSPLIAKWIPGSLKVYGTTGDPSLVIDHQYYEEPIVQFGISGTLDTHLTRPAAATLRINTGFSNTSDDAGLQVGDDSTLFDCDVADRLGIKGQQTAANGGLVFGSGKDTNLYRSAADTLKTDDTLEIATKLVVGTETFKAVTVSVANGATAYFADADLPSIGSALLHDDGDTGAGIVTFYRSGTYNVIKGITNNGTAYEFRGNTYSAGTGPFSFFIESNSAGARIGVKNNAGYDRSFTLVTF